MSSPGNSSGWLFVASLVSVLVLAVCGAGFLIPGRYQHDIEFSPTRIPESRKNITTFQARQLAELRVNSLALIKVHLAALDGASALSEKPSAERADLQEYTLTVETQQQLNQIHLKVRFDVLTDSLVTIPGYDLNITSLHYFIGVQSSQERMEQWMDKLRRLLEAWDSAIEQTLVKNVEAKEPWGRIGETNARRARSPHPYGAHL